MQRRRVTQPASAAPGSAGGRRVGIPGQPHAEPGFPRTAGTLMMSATAGPCGGPGTRRDERRQAGAQTQRRRVTQPASAAPGSAGGRRVGIPGQPHAEPGFPRTAGTLMMSATAGPCGGPGSRRDERRQAGAQTQRRRVTQPASAAPGSAGGRRVGIPGQPHAEPGFPRTARTLMMSATAGPCGGPGSRRDERRQAGAQTQRRRVTQPASAAPGSAGGRRVGIPGQPHAEPGFPRTAGTLMMSATAGPCGGPGSRRDERRQAGAQTQRRRVTQPASAAPGSGRSL